jgi:hypothetical protein
VGLDVSCPKGWGFYDPDLELSEYFCPRCDVAFMTLEDYLAPGGGMQDLRWQRVGGQLTPCQPDEEGLIKLSRKMWEVRKTLLFYHVASFVYWRSRPWSHLICFNDGGSIPVIGVIPYDAGSWIMLAWCWYCKVGFGRLSDPDYGWSEALTFRYDSRERSYRASLIDDLHWPRTKRALNVPRVGERLDELIVIGRGGVPGRVRSAAGPMPVEDAPVPVEPPASLWDGWMTGFQPGVLSRRPGWRGWQRTNDPDR